MKREIRKFGSYGACGPKTYAKAAFTPEVPGKTAEQIAQAARKAEIASRGLGQLQ